jgi:DtxR family Mn-dependent transcriptional regulator
VLTATQEDYLEAIHRLEEGGGPVQVSHLGERLGCKLPTVTRTLQKLVRNGFVDHESRGTIHLTETGRSTARHLVHRHEDLVKFLSLVLGLSPRESESNACQLEHGMSALAAQRLHRWLQHVDQLDAAAREKALHFRGREVEAVPDFEWLPEGKTAGWRG